MAAGECPLCGTPVRPATAACPGCGAELAGQGDAISTVLDALGASPQARAQLGSLLGGEPRPAGTDCTPSGIWTITKRHGEEMGRVRAQDHDGAVRAARGIYAVRQYEDAHGGFGLRRLTRSEAGPGADDEDI